ncbi:hypothetical protein NUSPORA_01836 [Nucleospora cyclopteri]
MVNKSEIENSILQYKIYENTIFFLVRWKDGTESWTRISNISNKNLVLDFVRNCLKRLRFKKNKEKEIEDQKVENILKEQLMKNSQETLKKEEKDFEEIKRSIIDGINKEKEAAKSNNYKEEKQFGEKHKEEERDIVISEKKINNMRKNAYENKGFNQIAIYNNEILLLICKFYFYEKFKNISIDIKNCVLVKFQKLASYLKFLQNNNKLYMCTFIAEENSKDFDFTNYLYKNELFGLVFSQNFAWVIYIPNKNHKLVDVSTGSSNILFRVPLSDKLKLYQNMKFDLGQTFSWVLNTYQAGLLQYEKNLFNNTTEIESGQKYFPIVDNNSYKGLHLKNYLSKYGTISSKIDKSVNVVLQQSYKDFIHAIKPNEKVSVQLKNVKYFCENDYKIQEVLKNGGILTFTNEFLEFGSLDNLIELFDVIDKKENWTIKIPFEAYKIFKKRLIDLNLSKEENQKFKGVYNAFKQGCIEFNFTTANDLRMYLEKKFVKTCRFVVVIGMENEFIDCMNIEDAKKFVISA